jgi:hypothetical protein
MLSNCYLLALLLFKTGFMTGIFPGIFFIYAAGKLVRALWVPTRDQLETWSESATTSKSIVGKGPIPRDAERRRAA